MKTFSELPEIDQQKAVAYCLNNCLSAIIEGVLHFDDKLNNDTLQADIDAGIAKAERMQTPWFAASYIMDTAAAPIIRSMAQADAEYAKYSEPEESVISLYRVQQTKL